MPPSFTEDALRAAIAPHVADADHARFARITTGKFNTSYYTSLGDAEYVLRIAPAPGTPMLFYERDMMKQEPAIHALLIANTDVPVARILAHDETHNAIDHDFLLMERLPGQAASESSLAPDAVDRLFEQTGRALAAIHAQTAERYGYLGEHRCMEPQRTWPEAFAIMWNKLLDDIAETGVYTRDELAALRALLEEHLACFDHAPPASLLHMDVWAQNLLTDREGNLTGLVDFDRALWGDPEIEFAVLDYCGVSTAAFWRGYGAERPQGREAFVRHRFYYLYEVQKYIVIRALRQRDPGAARSYRHHAMGLADELRNV